MKSYTLMQADYRDTLAAVAGQADLVFTSPPYADARTYGMGCNWTDADYAALGDAVCAALKPGGHALRHVDAPVRETAPLGHRPRPTHARLRSIAVATSRDRCSSAP